MKEIGEEVACGQLDILSRSGVPGTLTRVSKGLATDIHMNISANIHTHKKVEILTIPAGPTHQEEGVEEGQLPSKEL